MRHSLFSLLFIILAQALSAQGLSKQQAEQRMTSLSQEWIANTRQRYQEAWNSREIVLGDRKMPFWFTTYGTKPADGYSLVISLHGGGNAPKALNDSQWENQKVLYKPEHSIYLAPRAPYDDWDMWFKPALDGFYEQLIQMCVAYLDVNPDKVYLIGYSAGGDGVWRMGPRMADTWAAASMMAGHPGDVSLVNLRNTPFMVWCGALDAAYERNEKCTERGKELDQLQEKDPEGYLHETHIVAGKPHWMDLEDAAALPWLQQYQRNPYPTKIVWQQEEVLRQHFYWISAPKDELKRGQTVRVSIKGNQVNIEQCDYSSITLHFNDLMVNLDKPIQVRYQGKTLYKGKALRTEDCLQRTLQERGDIRYMFPAEISIKLK